jgi:hypothetical protein
VASEGERTARTGFKSFVANLNSPVSVSDDLFRSVSFSGAMRSCGLRNTCPVSVLSLSLMSTVFHHQHDEISESDSVLPSERIKFASESFGDRGPSTFFCIQMRMQLLVLTIFCSPSFRVSDAQISSLFLSVQ